MSYVCTKFKCSKRIALGSQNDPDWIASICPRCEILYFESESRKKTWSKKLKLGVIGVFLITIMSLFYVNFKDLRTDFLFSDEPEKVVYDFFEYINDREYEKAYSLTRHAKWNSLESFTAVFQGWKDLDIQAVNGVSYYSFYKPDTVFNVKYTMFTNKGSTAQNFDYLLKKINTDWKIIRIYNPRNPSVNALKKEEIPQNPVQAVNTFLDLLNEQLFEKAFLLTNNSFWGKKEKFISDEGWGCISEIIKYEVRKYETVSNTREIVYAKYYAKDLCNKSNTFEFYFYVDQSNDYWKIIKAKEEI